MEHTRPPRRFAPRLVPGLAALLVFGVTLALGNWQLDRAAQKQALMDRYEAAAQQAPVLVPRTPALADDFAFRPVLARGRYLADRMVLVDNRVQKGHPGYHVLLPLELEPGGVSVLVNRGWVPAGRDRADLPLVAVPEGPVEIHGRAVIPAEKVFELGAGTPVGAGRVIQHLTLDHFRAVHPIALQPFIIQEEGPAEGLVRDWPVPDAGKAKHQGYALQWFSLAALTVVLFVVLSLRRGRD